MIFYQHSNKQLAFALSTDVAIQICAWCADNEMPEQFSKSITSISGGKSLKFEFDVISHNVISLRVGGFAISCKAV
ncbi:hypothetical protein LC612_21630 [Nostoc sp. CHAB 5834]|nr:hypothetical protein [Nostoc sp. CHAB 5834]